MKKINKTVSFIIVFMQTAMFCVAQPSPEDILRSASLQPIEPTTASLGRYGEYQMDYSNGLPDISIPLYEIKSGDLTVPIVLRYQGGGIKVQQEATWVGLGWNLFYGGQVTRVVQGFPDENEPDKSQRPTANNIQNYINTHNNSSYDSYLDNLTEGKKFQYSYMPDDYYYNMGIESGKFIGQDVEALIPYKPIKIVKGGKFGTAWQITNSQGYIYYYGQTETTETLEENHVMPKYTSAWYIKSIVSPTNHIIHYEYQDDGVYTSNNAAHYAGFYYSRLEWAFGSMEEDKSNHLFPLNQITTVMKVTCKKPQYIYFEGGRLTFALSARTDILLQRTPGSSPIQKLDYIKIETLSANNTYTPIKTIFFDYSYINENNNIQYRRLKLNKLYEYSHISGTTQNIAVFTYNTTPLPAKDSYNYDYCGYYNGSNNKTPIPFYRLSTPYGKVDIGDANKNVINSYTQAGMLLSIEYPTKGKTVFTWENHRYGEDKPLYMNQYITNKTVYVRVRCPSLNHDTPPSPHDENSCEGNNSETFTCHHDQTITLHGEMTRRDMGNSHTKFDEARIVLRDNTTDGICFSRNISKAVFEEITTFEEDIMLQANHSYSLSVEVNCSQIGVSAYLAYNDYNPGNDQYNFPYGGLRIKEIVNYDTDNRLLDKSLFTYILPDNNSKSSGYITNKATILLDTYSSNSEAIMVYKTNTTLPICVNKITYTHLFYDNPLTGIYPNNLSYQYVQVRKIGQNNVDNGSIQYEFKKAMDIILYRNMPIISMTNERNLMLKENVYNNSNQLLEETKNYYSNHLSIRQSTRGLKVFCHLSGRTCDQQAINYPLKERFEPADYIVPSTWCKLDSTVKYSYYNSNAVRQKTEYVYGDTLSCQPTQITTLLDNGRSQITTLQYPSQLTDAVSLKMKEKNQVGQFVSKEEKINTTVLSKQTNKYSIRSVTPATGSYESSELISLDSVRMKYGTGTEETEVKVKRDTKNSIIEYLPRSNTPVVYLWGYNYQYPVAKIENATYEQVKTRLGETLINRVAAATEPATADWTTLNNLRTQLPDVQVTVYKYKPLVGLETVTDPRGVVTTYVYDSFGRLQTIKDENNKTVESYEYHYKN